MGARLAFECVQAMRLHGISLPKHLIISGRRAPHRSNFDILGSDLTNEEMIVVLKKYGGLNDALLNDEDVLSFLLPLMRSDLRLLEQFQSKVTLPLTIPMTAIGGAQDRLVSKEDLQAWKGYTIADFKCQMFEGRHFFLLKESLNQVGQFINAIVTQEG
jgi:medium-chain acyl-[acyl-carrier-protein] hydrolase